MNAITKVTGIVICCLCIGCFSTDDDGFGGTVSLTIEDAFSFQNEKEYRLGDTLYFELEFSRYLPEEGYQNLLDIYETTDDDKFGYSFGFEKFSELENGFRTISIDPQFIIAEESDFDQYYFYSNYGTVAILNAAQDSYTSRVGVVLKEEGTFRFDFDNVFLQNGYAYEKVQVSISHRLSGDDAMDLEFRVRE